MTSFLSTLAADGVELRLFEGRIQHRPADLAPELREFIKEHREAILVELQARAHGLLRRCGPVATPSLAPCRDPFEVRFEDDEKPAEDADAGPWWTRPGFDVGAWLLEAERHVRFELVDGSVTRRARGPYMPPWVCSDAYQLERAGVLAPALRARLGQQPPARKARASRARARANDDDGPRTSASSEVA